MRDRKTASGKIAIGNIPRRKTDSGKTAILGKLPVWDNCHGENCQAENFHYLEGASEFSDGNKSSKLRFFFFFFN